MGEKIVENSLALREPPKSFPHKKKSIGKNYIYNLIYQLFLLIVPIIVTPYVARVLGDEGSGKYSFSFSLLTYFTLFANLGFSTYAQREIAKYQGDKEKQSKLFWEILVSRFIPTLITLLIYFILIGLGVFGENYTTLMLILAINIVAVFFDIAFFFQANEEFGKMVINNIIIKAFSFIAIFIFVKTQEDLWKYALIQSITVLFGFLVLWVHLPKSLQKVSIKDIHPLKHLLPAIILFLPTIATSVYTSLDKTLIGLLVPGEIVETLPDGTQVIIKLADIENGNYEYAEKLVKMALTVITSLGSVMIPRNTKYFAEGKLELVKENIYKSSKFVFIIGIPLVLGCIVIADNLIPWYLGSEYTKASSLMKLLSPLILFIGFSNVFGLQYLIPSGQDKKYMIAIVAGALLNLSLNLILIKYYQGYGAAIATIVAELFVSVLMCLFARKNIKFLKILFSSWKYFIAGTVMFVGCYFLARKLDPSILNTFLIAGLGVLLYILLLFVFQDLYFLQNIKMLLKKIRIKNNIKS